MAIITEPTVFLIPDGRTPGLDGGNFPYANDLALTGLMGGSMAVAWTTLPNSYSFDDVGIDPDDYGLFVQVLRGNLGQGTGVVRLWPAVDIQSDVSIAATQGGGFLLTWAEQAINPDAASTLGAVTIRAQAFNALVQPVSPVIDLAGDADASALLALGGDRFALTLEGGATDEIRVQLFDLVAGTNGAAQSIVPAGAPIVLGSGTSAKGMTALPDGGLAVIWKGAEGGLSVGLLDGDGTAQAAMDLGVTGLVNTPNAIGLPDGEILVTWHDATGIAGRRLDAAGAPLTPVFRVNDGGTPSANDSDLTLLPNGDVLVSWEQIFEIPTSSGSYDQEFVVGVVLDPDAPGPAAPFQMFRGRNLDTDIYGHEVTNLANGTLAAVLGSSGSYSSWLGGAVWNIPTVTLFTPDLAYHGTEDDDTITSGDAASDLRGYGGDDLLTGGAGDDLLDGGDGQDILRGGAGNDTLSGGAGYNKLHGDHGDDSIIGGALHDNVTGGEGNDYIDTAEGNDLVYGQAGNDTIFGSAGADTLVGGTGDDILSGGSLSDLLFGGDGFDFINGGAGSDRLNGGAGADRFFHAGVRDHGSDWIQDYTSAEGDVLLFGGPANTAASDFLIQRAFTPSAGSADVQEIFVTQISTRNILWALVDGDAQAQINIQIGGQVFDLLA